MSLGLASRQAAERAAPRRARRVAFVIHNLSGGGAERVVSALSARCVHDGREVTVVTLASAERDFYPLHGAVRRVALGVTGDSRGPLEAAAHSLARTLALRDCFARLAPDAVVSFMPQTNVLALLAAAPLRLPVIVCERSNPSVAPLGRAWALLRRSLYPRASAVVVQTQPVARWVGAFCDRVHVIPNFVEPRSETAAALAAPGAKRVFAMGRLVLAKGFDLLLPAFARAAADRPDWSLTILGEGPERAGLESLAAALGVSGRVSMPGRVTDPWRQLIQGQLFVLSSRYEGFPNALLEAMACGLPVVSFDCPCGPADAIAHGRDGLLVPAGDVAALAATLAALMDSPEERVRLGGRARSIASRLGPERILPRWTALLDETAALDPSWT